MFKSAFVVLVAVLMVLTVPAHAQGTQNPNSGSSATNRASGAGTGAQSDPMGGAFRGTGTPNFGTSPGMGSDNRRRN